MTLPTLTPPTDNLYKFAAICGVIFILFGTGFPLYANKEMAERQLADFKANSETWKSYDDKLLAFMKESERAFLEIMDKMEAMASKNEPPSKTYQDTVMMRMREQAKMREDYAKAHVEIKARQLSTQSILADNSHKNEQLYAKWVYICCNILVVVGVMMTVGGFRLWYVRNQSIQDRIMAAQLKEIEQKIAPTPTPSTSTTAAP